MRILQLTPRIPWPPVDGGRVVMLQIARALQRNGCEVHILSLNPRKQRVDVEDARRALAPITLDAIDIDTSNSLAAAFKALVLRTPLIVARFFDVAYDRALRAILQSRSFDLVQMESPFLLPYLHAIRETTTAPVVLRSLNVEFRIWEQLAENETNVFRRRLYAHIARTLRRHEVARLDACDAIVPITDEDAALFRDLGCTRPIHVLPGGVDPPVGWRLTVGGWRENESPALPPTANRQPPTRSAYFLGSLDYRPNQEAALWIAHQLRPRLGPDVQLHIGGSNAPPSLRAKLAVEGVSLANDVRDAAAFAAPMAVMIAPLFAGGGMRIKILEAMALGEPVVSTTVGAAGIGVTDGVNIRLADDADAFAAAVTELLDSPLRARAIGDAGRRFVMVRYATDVLAQELLAFYEQLTQRRGVNDGR